MEKIGTKRINKLQEEGKFFQVGHEKVTLDEIRKELLRNGFFHKVGHYFGSEHMVTQSLMAVQTTTTEHFNAMHLSYLSGSEAETLQIIYSNRVK